MDAIGHRFEIDGTTFVVTSNMVQVKQGHVPHNVSLTLGDGNSDSPLSHFFFEKRGTSVECVSDSTLRCATKLMLCQSSKRSFCFNDSFSITKSLKDTASIIDQI